ncbi:MAG: molecular chaperone DnaK, partial [Opitutae bacterium]|nr:molecular chaperone DnaK [Opitutae bacterium]
VLARRFDLAGGPRVLDNPRPDLAVAVGAAYYGWVKSGQGVRVGSGSPRAYYLGVGQSESDDTGSRQAVCLVERGLEEGSRIGLDGHRLEVVANRPVRFDLFSSSFRSGDRCGDMVEIDETLTRLPPLQTVVAFGQGRQQRHIPVRVEAAYSETGTLSLWCASLASEHRWQLRFQLRGPGQAMAVPVEKAIDTRILTAVRHQTTRAFATDDPVPAADLAAAIAAEAGAPKEEWSLGLLRCAADALLEQAAERHRTAAHEASWLNLTGYCLRPGFGDGADPHRLKQLWRVYLQGPRFSGKPQVAGEWWILWRRVAGGLNAGQQRQFLQDIAGRLDRQRAGSQVHLEMWMALASMERLLVKDKIARGRTLLDELSARKCAAQLFWALG